MKYKMVCLDMDGTLLSQHKEVSERNKKILTQLRNRGVRVVVCTGRAFASARYFADIVGESVDVIASNGAIIINEKNEVLFESRLGYSKGIQVLDIMKENGIEPHFYSRDTIFTEKMINSALFYQKYNEGVTEERHKIKFQLVNDWDSVLKENEDVIMKAVGFHQSDEVIVKVREEFLQLKGVEMVYSHIKNFEIMNEGISKGSAISKLAQHYGIEKEEIISFGDSNNDLSMIEYAGLGVAMGNGSEEIKNAADMITETNDDDGVAKALEKIFF